MDIEDNERETVRNIVDMCYNIILYDSLGANSLTLTTKYQGAMSTISSYLKDVIKREPFTYHEIKGLKQLGWQKLEEFASNYQNLPPSNQDRIVYETEFLARVDSERPGVAIWPRLAGALFTGIAGAAPPLVGVYYPDVFIQALVGATSTLAILQGENLERIFQKLQVNRLKIKYDSILNRRQ